MRIQTHLISAGDLAEALGDPDLAVFDCRHDLMNPEVGARAYQATHIAGAQFLHCDHDLSGPKTGANGRHPLPDPEAFATLLAERGVDNETQVVAYDDADGIFASRLWWMLRWLGHERVAVLDGGFPAWVEEGLPRARGIERRPSAYFGYRLMRNSLADAQFVHTHLNDPGTLLLDARAPERFRGEAEPLDPVAGHVPGAVNRFFGLNLDADGRFKPPSLLRAEYELLLKARDARDVVHMCGSGVTACHNLLAMEIAGLCGSRLYAGSWSEWCSDPARPIVCESCPSSEAAARIDLRTEA
jgi:thiosulfate/3-mercaptopyruvate sulfurtransferase